MSSSSVNATSSYAIRDIIGTVNFLLTLPFVLISTPFVVWYTPKSVYTVISYPIRAAGEALGYYHDSFTKINEHMQGKPLFLKTIIFSAVTFALMVNSVFIPSPQNSLSFVPIASE